jgi:hypothetical protein
MLTDAQKLLIITLALQSFKNQKGLTFNPSEFELIVGSPNNVSLCSIYIVSKRTNDNFRIKLYIKEFGIFSNVDNFVLTQEENYGPGHNDEVHLANCTLDKKEFVGFYRYLTSQQFITDVMTATHRIVLEDNSGFIALETSPGLLVLEN